MQSARTTHNAALISKNTLGDNPQMSCPRPPTSINLTGDDAQSVMPFDLYNVMAWATEAPEIPTLVGYIDLPDVVDLKNSYHFAKTLFTLHPSVENKPLNPFFLD